MGRLSGSLNYDFKAGRSRIDELTGLYRLAKHNGDEMACWALAAEIEEIEREIHEAHRTVHGKMTALAGGHSVVCISYLVAPIVPQWVGEHKGTEHD